MAATWPTTDLDAIARMRILRGSVYAPMYTECHLDAPLDRVWEAAANLERLPDLIPTMQEFRVLASDGERIRAVAISGGHGWLMSYFDVRLTPGWCLMQSRRIIGGMAAVTEGSGTRFAVLGGVRIPGARLLRPLLATYGSAAAGRMIRRLRAVLEHCGP